MGVTGGQPGLLGYRWFCVTNLMFRTHCFAPGWHPAPWCGFGNRHRTGMALDGSFRLAGLLNTSFDFSFMGTMHSLDRSLVWFRRDLRTTDHAALSRALETSRQVFCVFVFDRDILDPLLEKGLRADRRVEFLLASIAELDAGLRALGGGLIVRHAYAPADIVQLAAELEVDAVFVNHDYEPQAIVRDSKVSEALMAARRTLITCKDQVIFEKDDVLSQSGKPFSVFTPYKNAWLRKLNGPDGGRFIEPYPVSDYSDRFAPIPAALARLPFSLEELGFVPTNLAEIGIPTGMSGAQALLEDFHARMPQYEATRNFPAVKGPSYLSVHLRFGTISVRHLARQAVSAVGAGDDPGGAATWLSELIWRDFYFMILFHHPHVAERAFKPEYDRIEWEEGDAARRVFEAWCEGRTGYPLVDAAMHQLNRTGYMHNRLRMVTACFLIKDLGIDWRRGEAYFADRLNDFDLSANNGGWQWASSSGCDAQPYFRIFNPVTQSEKFDPEGKFIRRYLPQLGRLGAKHVHAPWLAPASVLEEAGIELGTHYPHPVVRHDEARQRTLVRYGIVKKSADPAT
jgi:deoxyribodipyrimidine photo-lyase